MTAGAVAEARVASGGARAPASAAFSPAPDSGAEFRGGVDSVTFIGDLPTGLGTTRRANITLALRQGRLVLRWTPRRHEISAAAPPEPAEIELVRQVEHLDLAYWGALTPDQPTAWQGKWEGSTLPDLIRLRLSLAGHDRRRFPDLIAATQP